MNLRLFCAISVPNEVGEELANAVEKLRGPLSGAPISWVGSSNFHLTLSFLGDVDERRVPELAKRIQESCRETEPFEIACQQLGCFPNVKRPRVIWAGVENEAKQLTELQGRVAVACAPFAEREEKGRFHGHITLGRVRPGSKVPLKGVASEIERNRDMVFGRWMVHEVELVCSDLSHGPPRYTALHRFSL